MGPVKADFLQLLRNLSLRSKILLMILPASLVSMGVASLIGYLTAREALTAQATAQITAIRSAKKAQIESYFQRLRDTFGVFAEDVALVSATQLFVDGFNQLGRQKLSAERQRALKDYYGKQFAPELVKVPGFEHMTADSLLPRNDRSAEAQALFIAENPHKPGERAKLLDHPVSNPYTLAHFAYHGWLKDIADRLKLYDLFIVSDAGTVVYSTAKEVDFATSLVDGPYATTILGRLYRQVSGEHRKGYVKVTDFEFYAPSLGAPAMFIATPIYANFKLVGVLIGQLSIDEISRTMNGDKSWRQDGLGETGFAFVVGPSMYLRNDHRGFVEKPKDFLDSAAGQGYRPTEIAAMRSQNTTVLRYKNNIEGVRRALLGETGVVTARNTLGQDALQAFAPLAIADLNWVVGVNIEKREILAPLDHLRRMLMIVACALTLLSTLLAMWLASGFVRPIQALMDGIDAIRSGKTDVKIPKSGNDEFGRLTDSFNTMAATIRERDDVIAGKNKAYTGLLNRIFPEVVAERMRSGEERIVDTFPNVTLIYASVIGFSRETDGMSGEDSMRLLNELIDSFDNLAKEHGIERVKTFGEHYLAACGLSVPRLDHAERAVAFADLLASEVRRVSGEHGMKLDARVSVASGKVHAGLVGNHKFVYDVWGRPLNLVRRLIHEAVPGEICITDESYRLLGSPRDFEDKPELQSLTLGSIKSHRRLLDHRTSAAGVDDAERTANRRAAE